MHSPHTRRRLPQCLIIGVRKAGSRALLNFLNLHSKIQTARREVHFFDHDNNYSQGYDWYRQQMPYTFKDQITIEKSPSYFVVKGVPERVYQMNSTIRLLLIVREPVARAVSDYLQIRDVRLNRGKIMEPFETLAIDNETGEINRSYNAIKRSVYHRHLQKWLLFFDLDQIHIIDGDNLVKRPWEEMYMAEEFLGLEHEIKEENFVFNSTRGFFCTVLNSQQQHCLSQGKGRPHPAIDKNVLRKLKDFFRPLNEKFFHLVGQSFNW
ncbi:heparan sulfate glucosamine 3-O-sulfotransferase 5-like [Gigantopelta aegis]|uniref:heparan sulfate glucosamine 3-O-sulfotransferase 5-like n=1 Tax=Gigantopelta aegis TaxID=1735272 RepID=UPI001B889B75|nr:heparan sulfate glucosamine 3-O-sulfotransferase 5-like [Gigantopelta aegis]